MRFIWANRISTFLRWDDTTINPIEAEFLNGLFRHGYVEGRNVIADRYAVMGSMDRFPDFSR